MPSQILPLTQAQLNAVFKASKRREFRLKPPGLGPTPQPTDEDTRKSLLSQQMLTAKYVQNGFRATSLGFGRRSSKPIKRLDGGMRSAVECIEYKKEDIYKAHKIISDAEAAKIIEELSATSPARLWYEVSEYARHLKFKHKEDLSPEVMAILELAVQAGLQSCESAHIYKKSGIPFGCHMLRTPFHLVSVCHEHGIELEKDRGLLNGIYNIN